MNKAEDICSIVDTAEPFMCFDLIYIITLLQDGYDLQPTTKLIVGFFLPLKLLEFFKAVHYFFKISISLLEIDVQKNRQS